MYHGTSLLVSNINYYNYITTEKLHIITWKTCLLLESNKLFSSSANPFFSAYFLAPAPTSMLCGECSIICLATEIGQAYLLWRITTMLLPYFTLLVHKQLQENNLNLSLYQHLIEQCHLHLGSIHDQQNILLY